MAAASECSPRLIRNCHTCFQNRKHLDSACRHDLLCSERLPLLSSLQVYAPKVVIIYRDNITVSNNSYSFNYLFIYFFFFHWHYSQLWATACRIMSFHFFLSFTSSLHLLTPSTWRSLSTSSFHLFLGFPLLLGPSSSWVKNVLGILSSSILSRWPNQLILCPFIHFTIFSPLLISSSSRFVRLFHSPFSYLRPYIRLNIFLSRINSLFFFLRQRPCFRSIRHYRSY